MASDLLGSLLVRLAADAGQFESDLGRAARIAERNAKAIEKKFADMATKIGGAMATAAAAAVAATAALAKQAIDTADEFAKMSQKVGVSVEALSTLEYAAEQSGISVEQLQGGLTKLAKNASDAATGTGTARLAFEAMGISVNDAGGRLKTTEQLLLEVSNKMAGYQDSAQKTALAVQVFGRAGAEMIPFLNEGAAGIAELQERARALRLEISGNTASQAEQFNDLLSDLGRLSQGLGRDIDRELLPGLVKLAELFVDNGIKARQAGESTNVFAEGLRTIIGVTIAVVAQVQKLGAALGAVAVGVGQLGEFMRDQFAGIKKFQDDVFDIGPIDAYAKFAETSFGNVGGYVERVNNNVDLLNKTFAAIDESATARIGALGTRFAETGKAVAGATATLKSAAPAIVDTAKATAEAEKRQAAYSRMMASSQKEQSAWIRQQIEAAQALKARFATQEKDITTEINLLRMSTADRQAATIALQAEELARNDLGAVIDEQREKFEALLTELHEATEVEEILSRFDNIGLGGLIGEIEKLGKALDKATDPEKIAELESAMSSLSAQVQSENIGSFKALLGAAQTFTEEGSKGFKAMEVGMAALSIVQDILALKAAVTAVLTQGQGDPYSAFARMAAMAAAVAPFIASIGLTLSSFGGSGSNGGSNGAEARQARQGTGTVLGDAEAKSESMLNALEITADATSKLVGLSRGMLNALQSMQRGIGAASGSLARTDFADLTLAEGAGTSRLFDPLGIGGNTIGSRVISSIFGGDQDLIDQGLLINGGLFGDISRNPIASTYQTIETDGGWFGSDDIDDELAALGEAATNQIRLILTSIGDAVREGAAALGIDMEQINAAIEAFRLEEIRISTMDLTGEEAQAELEAAFSAIFDGLAGAVVPFIDQFQRVGEGLGETLVRVATGVQVTQEALTRLGFSLDETDPERFAQISESLIELSGGIEQFIEGMSSFVDKFAPESHIVAMLQSDLSRALEQVGLTIPPTRDAMWELMQSLDATTEAGREQIAALLRLSEVADQYFQQVDDLWSRFYETFYNDQERAALAMGNAQNMAAQAFAAIGLSVDQFVGSNGLSLFRQLFESTLPELTAEQTLQWLQAANSLGLLIQVTQDYASTLEQVSQSVQDSLGLILIRPGDGIGGEGQWEPPSAGGEPYVPVIPDLDLPNFTPPVYEYTPYEPPPIEEIAPDFTQQLADLLDRLRFDDATSRMDEFQRKLAEINRRWSETTRQATEWGALPAQLAEIERFRMNELSQAITDRYESEMEWVDRIRGYVDSLLLNDQLSTLTPQQKLEEARAQYEQLLSAAQSGDVVAREALQGGAEAYLREARDFFSSSQAYTDIFSGVTGSLSQLAAAVAGQASYDRLIAQINELGTQQQQDGSFVNVDSNGMLRVWMASNAEPSYAADDGTTLDDIREETELQTETLQQELQAVRAELSAMRAVMQQQVFEQRRLADAAVTN